MKDRNELFTQADGMAAGLQIMEASASTKKNKEARLRTDLEAARQTDETYHQALSENVALKMKLRNLRLELSKSYAALKTAKDARDYSEQVLRWRMKELVDDLSNQLNDDDPAWYSFGLNRPSDPETPAVPEHVEVIAGLEGTIHIHWEPAARANRYKVYIRKDGDEDDMPVLATHDTYAVVRVVNAHTISIRVSAANRAGESPLSSTAELAVREQQFATSA